MRTLRVEVAPHIQKYCLLLGQRSEAGQLLAGVNIQKDR